MDVIFTSTMLATLEDFLDRMKWCSTSRLYIAVPVTHTSTKEEETTSSGRETQMTL